MRRFVQLYAELDASTSTSRKVRAMARYFGETPPEDAAWGLFFLMGRRQKRVLSIRALAGELLARTALPSFLIDECYAAVGDLGEVLALLMPGEGDASRDLPLHRVASAVRDLGGLELEGQVEGTLALLEGLDATGRLVLIKMLTGELRVGVSELLALEGLARASGIDRAELQARVLGEWEPSAERFASFIAPGASERRGIQPYPFFLATPIDPAIGPAPLGEASEFFAEWKWDGIRCQLVKRDGQIALWSRGEELITDRFPELVDAAASMPDAVVLDGEAIPLDPSGAPLPFALLQKRIGRKKLGPKILAEVPMYFIAYDLLEEDDDLRARPFVERRARLEALLGGRHPRLTISQHIEGSSWQALAERRAEARERGVEGLMLKRLSGVYGTTRSKGDLFKWKIEPFEVDAVMMYAHPGHGRRSNRYTDYTFGVWKDGELVPIARAYSGITDAEIETIDRWVRSHTLERFGPTRAVEPVQVFTLHFEGIARSSRHKSGIALRFPRMHRWRDDKPATEAGTYDELLTLLDPPPPPPTKGDGPQ